MKILHLCLLVLPILTACATVDGNVADAGAYEEKDYTTGSRIPSRGQSNVSSMTPEAAAEMISQSRDAARDAGQR
jgi:hypothetical protein